MIGRLYAIKLTIISSCIIQYLFDIVFAYIYICIYIWQCLFCISQLAGLWNAHRAKFILLGRIGFVACLLCFVWYALSFYVLSVSNVCVCVMMVLKLVLCVV